MCQQSRAGNACGIVLRFLKNLGQNLGQNTGTDTGRTPVNTTRIEAVPGTTDDRGPGRFSTTVENSVENSGVSGLTAMKSLVVSGSAYGEGNFMAVLSAQFGS
jgi:hypothetical protein